MTIQTINLGNYANDGTGDDLRTAFEKVNANFTELGASDVRNGINLGSGSEIFAQRNNNAELEFKTLTSIDNSVTITHDATTVNLKASASIVEDTAPQLGGNLDLQSYYIYHGDVQTSIYGINVPLLNSLVQLMLTSGQLIVDLGNFLDPIDTNLDMGDITGPYVYSQNNIDFGSFELSQ